jgi:anion-transporting  ArsA/GET3 family ATPase
VGKTTITAALARMAARAGLDVLVVELEGKPGVTTAFGGSGPLGYGESSLPDDALAPDGVYGDAAQPDPESAGGLGTVHARRITPDDALLEYLADHGMGRISKRLVSSGALDVVSTAIPGLRDILVLGKIKQLERESDVDLILVDAPATGHAMTFLTSAQGLLDAARSGPVRAQAADVVELLSDPDRCQVALVTLPEEMPVNEVIEAAYQLEDRVGLTLGPVIVNGCLPDQPLLHEDPAQAAADLGVELTDDQRSALSAAAAFRASRLALQQAQRRRLAEELPLQQLEAPVVLSDAIGPVEIDQIARALARAVEKSGTDSRSRHPTAPVAAHHQHATNGAARPGAAP